MAAQLQLARNQLKRGRCDITISLSELAEFTQLSAVASELSSMLMLSRASADKQVPLRANTSFTPAGHVQRLNLPTRLTNALINAGVLSIDQLRALSDDDLKLISNIGEQSVGKLRQAVERHTAQSVGHTERSER